MTHSYYITLSKVPRKTHTHTTSSPVVHTGKALIKRNTVVAQSHEPVPSHDRNQQLWYVLRKRLVSVHNGEDGVKEEPFVLISVGEKVTKYSR